MKKWEAMVNPNELESGAAVRLLLKLNRKAEGIISCGTPSHGGIENQELLYLMCECGEEFTATHNDGNRCPECTARVS